LANTTGSEDSLFGELGELLGTDDAGGSGKGARSKDLVETLRKIII
jgi:hypothetical protein